MRCYKCNKKMVEKNYEHYCTKCGWNTKNTAKKSKRELIYIITRTLELPDGDVEYC